jgi:L-asparaginase II
VSAVPLVRAVRSGFVESVHVGSVAVADAGGKLVASAGDPDRVAFARSSMKPLQAAVSLSLMEDPLSDPEVAVMCASHNGEAVHVAAVHRILQRGDIDVGALRCPEDRPLEADSAAAVARAERRFHNCSGKHAGMLLACARQGWDIPTYTDPDHPLQRRVLEAVRAVAGAPRAVGVDGCGVPVHALSLREMATMYARLAAGSGLGSMEAPARRAVGAMRAEPYLVAGRGRVCTAVMTEVDGVIVKVGAEGLVCAGVAPLGLGVAIKADDGAARAQAPAVVHALRLLRVLEEGHEEVLADHARPPQLGGGIPVGHLEPVFELRS